MATLIDTVTPPVKSYPSPFGRSFPAKSKHIASLFQNANGRRRVQLTTNKLDWQIDLQNMTSTEKNNLKADLESGSVLYLTMPDAATIFTVVRDPNTDIDIVAVTFAAGTQYEMRFKLLEE